jgi:hypothetical protein
MDNLQEEITKEGAKLEALLRQAGYRMVNFNINSIHPENKSRDITIWAMSETGQELETKEFGD